MTLTKRKRTIRSALRDIVVAPFSFVIAGIVGNIFLLILAAILMAFCMWMAREPIANLIPTKDTVYMILAVIAFVAVAAIPLALRDYFSNGGYYTVWEPTDGCLEAATTHIDLLIAGDTRQFYTTFSPKLKAAIPSTEFDREFESVTDVIGLPFAIADIEEMTIPDFVFNDPEYDSTIDCIVQVVLNHKKSSQSLITLYMNSTKSFQIANIQFSPTE